MRCHIIVILITLVLFPIELLASVPNGNSEINCAVTPAMNNLKYAPNQFNTTNNARLKMGAFYPALGQHIVLYGQLTDKNCIPISNAKILIWQANIFGLYQYNSMKSENDYPKAQNFFDPNFVGSATTITDNMGRYQFLTVLPGRVNGISPHINMRVLHSALTPFETKIYFSEIIDNQNDPDLQSIDPNERSKLLAMTYSHGTYNNETNNFFEPEEEQGLFGENNYYYIFNVTLNQIIRN